MQCVIHLNTVALRNLFRYASFSQIGEQCGRLQPGYFKVLECRFLRKWHGLVRLCDRHIHLFSDVSRLLNEICLAGQAPCECEDVATLARAEIIPYIFAWSYMKRRFFFHVDSQSQFNNPEKEWVIMLSGVFGDPPEPSLFD